MNCKKCSSGLEFEQIVLFAQYVDSGTTDLSGVREWFCPGCCEIQEEEVNIDISRSEIDWEA